MSKAEKVTEVSFKNILAKFNKHKVELTIEIVAIYMVAVITIFAFFDNFKILFYTTFGYLALFTFLIILCYILIYILYNFSVVIYELFIRKPN